MEIPEFSAILKRIEPLGDYCPGGYHPVSIGDQLSERFTIVDKLGWGSSSTVWLAQDHADRNACVVISISKSSVGDAYRQQLVPKTQHLQSGDDRHPGKKNLLFPLESFSISGPNGKHFCLVMGFEGQTISRATNRAHGPDTRPLPLQQAKKAVIDLGNAISYMHAARMTHNDLHPANLYLGISKDNPWTVEKFESVCGKPKIVATKDISNLTTSVHMPQYLIEDAFIHRADFSLFTGPFKVADFGLAFHWNETSPKMSSAGPYIVPERVHDISFDGSADIWMYGCAIFQLLSGFDLMGTINDPAINMIHQFMNILGPPPDWMLRLWENMYGESAINPISEPGWPLARRVEEIRIGNEEIGMNQRLGEFEEEDMRVLTELLAFILKFEPKERPDIQQVLDHPSMAYFRS